jgi:hypothetical protein|tara:strand:- start:3023 stop:3334 length:312 start_codon:yes stop_codon:yes gene_type:complete
LATLSKRFSKETLWENANTRTCRKTGKDSRTSIFASSLPKKERVEYMIWYPESMLYEEYRIWNHEQRRVEKKLGIEFQEKDIEHFRREIFEPMLEEIYARDDL